MPRVTVSQLNKIGERLRKNIETEEDLLSLDKFRLSFQPAYDQVFAELTSLGLQIRTMLQHSWASTTEKLADVIDSKIKYGGGPKEIQEFLSRSSELIASIEKVDNEGAPMLARFKNLSDSEIQQMDRQVMQGDDKAFAFLVQQSGGLANFIREGVARRIELREDLNELLKCLADGYTMYKPDESQ